MDKKIIIIPLIILFIFFLLLGAKNIKHDDFPTEEVVSAEKNVEEETEETAPEEEWESIGNVLFKLPEGYELVDTSTDVSKYYTKDKTYISMYIEEGTDIYTYDDMYVTKEKTIGEKKGLSFESTRGNATEYSFVFADTEYIYCFSSNDATLLETVLSD